MAAARARHRTAPSLSFVRPAVDVYFDGVGGYDYVQPPAIPEPHMAPLVLLGLAVVGTRTLQRRRKTS